MQRGGHYERAHCDGKPLFLGLLSVLRYTYRVRDWR